MWFTHDGECRWNTVCCFAGFVGCGCFVVVEDQLSIIWQRMSSVSSSCSSSSIDRLKVKRNGRGKVRRKRKGKVTRKRTGRVKRERKGKSREEGKGSQERRDGSHERITSHSLRLRLPGLKGLGKVALVLLLR